MQTTVDTNERGLTRLLVAGEIDMQVAPRLTEAIGDLLRDGHDRVVVDLSAVTFLDSSGLASLVDGYHQAKQEQATYRVCGAHGIVLRVLDVSGVAELLLKGTVAGR